MNILKKPIFPLITDFLYIPGGRAQRSSAQEAAEGDRRGEPPLRRVGAQGRHGGGEAQRRKTFQRPLQLTRGLTLGVREADHQGILKNINSALLSGFVP